MNTTVLIKYIVTKILPRIKTTGPGRVACTFCQVFKEKIKLILHKLLGNKGEENISLLMF